MKGVNMPKKKSKNNKFFREQMRVKTTGEFLNDQLKENGITDTGDMLSTYNTEASILNKNKDKLE